MKTKKQIARERVKRRANIRRGVRIAIYEANQMLAKHGQRLVVPYWWVPYTVAIAEGGRRGATPEDRACAAYWTRIRALSLTFQL